MPNVEINIGGRSFQVACADGQEISVQNAALRLHGMAKQLTLADPTISESQMLLMAGLMLADQADACTPSVAPTPAPEPVDLSKLQALVEQAENIADKGNGA